MKRWLVTKTNDNTFAVVYQDGKETRLVSEYGKRCVFTDSKVAVQVANKFNKEYGDGFVLQDVQD